jgi:PPOX class probable F420-dependent enzyme
MTAMTNEQRDAFLAAPRIARVATVRPDGSPHVVPIWYEWDGETLRFDTPPDFRKGRNLLADPRLAVVIDITMGGLRYAGVVMEGTARFVRDPEAAKAIAARVYRRYLGAEGLQSPTPQSMIEDSAHLIVELTPSKLLTWDFTESLAPIPDEFE